MATKKTTTTKTTTKKKKKKQAPATPATTATTTTWSSPWAAKARQKLLALAKPLPVDLKESNGHVGFSVRKKGFAWFVVNHHGDGIVGLTVKVPPGENLRLIAADPRRYWFPAYSGKGGWVGVRLDDDDVDWDAVAAFFVGAFRASAPKQLLAPSQAPAATSATSAARGRRGSA
jgi:hypothetical protein